LQDLNPSSSLNGSSAPSQSRGCPTPGRSCWVLPGSLLALGLATGAIFLLSAWRPYGRATDRTAGAEPVLGGRFRFPLTWQIQTLDPARTHYQSDIMVTQQIFDGLTAFDEQLNIVPALARYWEISPDSRTYTLELRPDARFHNGRPVTAQDCVFSFERLLTPGLNEDNYHYFSRIVGAEDFRQGKAAHVAGLRALDERTFQIRFATPFVPGLSVLSMYCSKILPQQELAAQGEDFFKAPIGSGAFRFAAWLGAEETPDPTAGTRRPHGIRLEANPDYFQGRPYLDELVYQEPIAPSAAKEPLSIPDLVDCLPLDVADARVGDWVMVESQQLAINYLVLPSTPPYDDPRVRRAIHFALDKRSFLTARQPAAGATPAGSVVPPGIPGFVPAKQPYDHNLKKARALLAEAGFASGRGLPTIDFVLDTHSVLESSERKCLESCLSRIGVRVNWLKATRRLESDEPALAGRPIMMDRGWVADFPDPDNFLRPLFHSSSPANLSGYRSAEVDRLLDRAWSETSYKARIELYQLIEKQILLDSPIIPLYYEQGRVLVEPNARGFFLSPLGLWYIKTNKIWLANQPHPKVRL